MKNGIIVSVTILVIAFICLISSNVIANVNRKKAEKQLQMEQQVIVEQQEKENEVVGKESGEEEEEVDSKVKSTVEPTVKPTTEPTEKSSDKDKVSEEIKEVSNTFEVFAEKDLDTLSKGTSMNEVMVIASKYVVLLSDNKKDNKQLMYVIDLFTSSGDCLSYYVSQSVYNSVEIGDKLKVGYCVYKNSNKVEFPVIESVSVVE